VGIYLAVGKLADITFDLKRILDISLVRKFKEAIFRLALRFFDSIFHLPWCIVVEISFNCRANTAKYRSKVRRYFEDNKARNSSKFALITFAQYCICGAYSCLDLLKIAATLMFGKVF